MTPADLDGVVEVARIGFPDHFEGRDCFENRLALSPDGCFVLAATDGPVRGYMVAYPWRRASAPVLNTVIDALPDDADLMYLHDLALHPRARGGGHARPVVEALAVRAREQGWPELALVAVNDAVDFWARHGFEVRDTPEMAQKLASYGADARYMIRPL
ncbi:MAG: GNAT family N-acetyltransferase [Brevundimonas sp.]|nr:MAG: GNAT family N-acetyltransferase [Brevundimonas sp.]